jgi:thymidylate synthase (FAD)
MPPVVTLLSQHPEPIRSLYMAFRVCYSSLTPEAILKRIRDERITEEQMLTFVEERLKTGHVSPLEQVWFEFGISGVSRAFSHQFVRTRVGMSPEQQSQRYVVYQDSKNDAVFPYITPPEVTRRGFSVRYERLMTEISRLYSEMIDAGVPGEDARFVLPNATSTNLKVTINFAALLHVSDLRLCFQAQWEYRRVAALMRAEIKKVYPMLAIQLQPRPQEYVVWFVRR